MDTYEEFLETWFFLSESEWEEKKFFFGVCITNNIPKMIILWWL